MSLVRALLATAAATAVCLPAWSQVDAAAAQALAKKSNCFKCHSIDKKRDGPPYKEVAAKLKGKPDAEDILFKHITTGPKVKIDGKEEEHEIVHTKNEAEIKNLVKWILSQ